MSNWAIQLKLMKYRHLCMDGVRKQVTSELKRGGRRILRLGRAAQEKAGVCFFSKAQRRNIAVLNIPASQHDGIASTAMQQRNKQHCFPVNSDMKGHVTLQKRAQTEGWREFFQLERKIRQFPSTVLRTKHASLH